MGTAIDRSDAATAHTEITPYLVSRFYRAPEIILGMPYDYAIDTWSIGCTLYEMYTGKILFTGDSNNQMLRAIMEVRGKMSGKLYRRGELWRHHFDEAGNFISQERDRVLGKVRVHFLSCLSLSLSLFSVRFSPSRVVPTYLSLRLLFFCHSLLVFVISSSFQSPRLRRRGASPQTGGEALGWAIFTREVSGRFALLFFGLPMAIGPAAAGKNCIACKR